MAVLNKVTEWTKEEKDLLLHAVVSMEQGIARTIAKTKVPLIKETYEKLGRSVIDLRKKVEMI